LTFEEYLDARLTYLLRYATVVTCDPHLAQDVVQNVMLRAHERWDRIGRTDQPEAYLKKMVLNEFLSWRRRSLRSVPMAEMDDLGGTVGDPADSVPARDALVRLIAGLPRRQRAVIALRYFEGISDAEIARLLDCGEATVRSHASRALITLRTAMSAITKEAS
jgi:RNA polymerase sigma-70 factor (sigma-E family)